MDIEYDPAKDAINQAKHGLPLAFGAFVLRDVIADVPDPHDYSGEMRRVSFGLVSGRLFVCVYTLRGETRRIISARKANSREQRQWLRP